MYMVQKKEHDCLIWIKKISNDGKTTLKLHKKSVVPENNQKEVMVFNINELVSILMSGHLTIVRQGAAMVASMWMTLQF